MIAAYLVCAGVALLVYWATSAMSHRWRIAISLIVFFALCGAATLSIFMIGDRPAPGDKPYNPNAGKPE
jgi:hypothetical protein